MGNIPFFMNVSVGVGLEFTRFNLPITHGDESIRCGSKEVRFVRNNKSGHIKIVQYLNKAVLGLRG